MIEIEKMRRDIAVMTLDIAGLRERLADHRGRRVEGADDLITELEAQYEALGVAEEELRVQVEEMAQMILAHDEDRQRYRELFDFSPDAYFVTDLHGLVVNANAEACDLVAKSPVELPGKPLASLVARHDVARFHDLLSLLHRAARAEMEVAIRHGREQTIVVTLIGRRSTDGRRLLWLARPLAGLDERDEADMELEEAIARERQARTELESSLRAKDHFLSLLAHDMRAPVLAIDGWATALRSGSLSPEGRAQAIGTIEEAARAQAALVTELFDLARLGAQKLRLDLGPFDLGEAVRRSVAAVHPAAHAKGVRITMDLDLDGPTTVADGSRMFRVVDHLVSRAVGVTAAGGEVRVDVRHGASWVQLEVRDGGLGTAEDELALVLAPAVPVAEGHVLGLHLAEQIVGLHRGEIVRQSGGLEGGSVVRLRLPVQRLERRTAVVHGARELSTGGGDGEAAGGSEDPSSAEPRHRTARMRTSFA